MGDRYEDIANLVNEETGSLFTGKQCKSKWANIKDGPDLPWREDGLITLRWLSAAVGKAGPKRVRLLVFGRMCPARWVVTLHMTASINGTTLAAL